MHTFRVKINEEKLRWLPYNPKGSLRLKRKTFPRPESEIDEETSDEIEVLEVTFTFPYGHVRKVVVPVLEIDDLKLPKPLAEEDRTPLDFAYVQQILFEGVRPAFFTLGMARKLLAALEYDSEEWEFKRNLNTMLWELKEKEEKEEEGGDWF